MTNLTGIDVELLRVTFAVDLQLISTFDRPLPDPDNYYDGQTYIVLNRQSSIFRFNRNKSLGIFSPESPIRNFCISLFIHPMFSRFMMLTVIVNCGFMTLSKPPPFVENVLEHVFMTIYTLECIVKIIARGFFVDQMSYVRDPWNLVDLFVVGLGYIMQIIDLVSPYIMKATQERSVCVWFYILIFI